MSTIITETPLPQETAVESNSSTETKTNRMVGQVKWFNNKVGYGFITIKDEENVEKDIFAHFSTIRTAIKTQYRYLVQGEYVEFDLSNSKDNTHEYQSSNISGINGGKLMCETRQLNRPVKREETSENQAAAVAPSRVDKEQAPRSGSGAPRFSKRRNPSAASAAAAEIDNDGFQVVRKRKI
jgi:cold shock CspA family protein